MTPTLDTRLDLSLVNAFSSSCRPLDSQDEKRGLMMMWMCVIPVCPSKVVKFQWWWNLRIHKLAILAGTGTSSSLASAVKWQYWYSSNNIIIAFSPTGKCVHDLARFTKAKAKLHSRSTNSIVHTLIDLVIVLRNSIVISKDHTRLTAPLPVCSAKLSSLGPG
jgi:hypothetical protein